MVFNRYLTSFILFFIALNYSSIESFQFPNIKKLLLSQSKFSSFNRPAADTSNSNSVSSTQKLTKQIGSIVIASGLFFGNNAFNAMLPIAVQPASADLISQLKVLQEAQNTLDAADIPFIDLPSKVSYREFREGKGSEIIQPGSLVTAEMSIRCESFKTANDPGGVKYYSTKVDTPNNELSWVIGAGTYLPGLEEGMQGMKKSAIRRIEIPSVQIFAARKANQLPLPASTNDDGNRRFKNLFKTDATLLFEVYVKSIDNSNIIKKSSSNNINEVL